MEVIWPLYMHKLFSPKCTLLVLQSPVYVVDQFHKLKQQLELSYVNLLMCSPSLFIIHLDILFL